MAPGSSCGGEPEGDVSVAPRLSSGGGCRYGRVVHEFRKIYRARPRLRAGGSEPRDARGTSPASAGSPAQGPARRSGRPLRRPDRPRRRPVARGSGPDRAVARQAAEGLRQRVRPAGDARADAPVRHRREGRREGGRFLRHGGAPASRPGGREGVRGRPRAPGGGRHPRIAERRDQRAAQGPYRRQRLGRERLRRAQEVCPRPHRGRPRRQARPGDRPRRGDPPDHPGPVPAHQEQPGPHRRARRRQDRHRRGAGPAHRQRRRARDPCATRACWPSTWAR